MGRTTPKIAFYLWASGPPIECMVPWANPGQPLKQHLDRFSRFRRAHERDQQTITKTDPVFFLAFGLRVEVADVQDGSVRGLGILFY